jgi:hypothetical protein
MITVFLGVLAALLTVLWFHDHRELRRQIALREEADERALDAIRKLHVVADGAMKGSPRVHWKSRVTGDEYTRVRIAGEDHFFTSQQLGVARRLANNLLDTKCETT